MSPLVHRLVRRTSNHNLNPEHNAGITGRSLDAFTCARLAHVMYYVGPIIIIVYTRLFCADEDKLKVTHVKGNATHRAYIAVIYQGVERRAFIGRSVKLLKLGPDLACIVHEDRPTIYC